MMGIVIAQLFRLYELPISEIEMPYYNASIPLSTACTAVGMIILMLGACRFYRAQAAMMRGKCLAGGWEVYTVMALSISVGLRNPSAMEQVAHADVKLFIVDDGGSSQLHRVVQGLRR